MDACVGGFPHVHVHIPHHEIYFWRENCKNKCNDFAMIKTIFNFAQPKYTGPQ